MHAKDQRGDKSEVKHAHDQPLFRCHFEIAALLIRFTAKEREQARQ
jgi:hypothetical protein